MSAFHSMMVIEAFAICFNNTTLYAAYLYFVGMLSQITEADVNYFLGNVVTWAERAKSLWRVIQLFRYL